MGLSASAAPPGARFPSFVPLRSIWDRFQQRLTLHPLGEFVKCRNGEGECSASWPAAQGLRASRALADVTLVAEAHSKKKKARGTGRSLAEEFHHQRILLAPDVNHLLPLRVYLLEWHRDAVAEFLFEGAGESSQSVSLAEASRASLSARTGS